MLRDLWSFIRPYAKRFWIGTFLRATNDIVRLFLPLIFGKIITFVAAYKPGTDPFPLFQLMAVSVAIGIYHHVMRDVAKVFIYPVAEKASIDARLKTISHMHMLDTAWHEKENSGNKMKRVDKGGESVNAIIRVYVDLLIESFINVIFITIVFSMLHWKLNTVFIFFFITYYFLSSFLTKKAAKQSHVVNVKWEEFTGLGFEMMSNIATLKSLGIGKNLLRFLNAVSKKLFEEIKLRVRYYRTRQIILNIYQELFRLAMVFFTVWEVANGRFEVGVIATVLLYFEKIESSAREFSDAYHEFMISKIGLMRVKEILDEKPLAETSGSIAFNSGWRTLSLKGVSFAYSKKNVLDNLSFSIKRGEKVGIVGISGTGKSTLFKLLLKLYDNYEGAILFDGISLHDIRRETFLPEVAVVPQETELFNISLKDNITIARAAHIAPNKEEKLFETSLKTAHVEDFLHKLPDGVDTLIGEKGVKLSGGERQRVGLARAVFKKPGILLLDEATSHLDSESEEKIQDALEEFFKGITAIVIAHRLSTLKKMDRILVIQKGAVAEEGSFDLLLRRKGEFWKLWQKQKF